MKNLEIEGKLIIKQSLLTGNGKNGAWSKQDFVIETLGEYPKKVAFTAWNDKADFIIDKPIGTTLKISFNVESREYNERWYTELRAWKIETNGNQTTASTPQPQKQNTENTQQEKEGDDLPF